jgi:DNA-binding NarL/FixJ family response regulator
VNERGARPAPIRVALADDHELVLEGLRALLQSEDDITVVATATNGDELLAEIRRHKPDVVAMDLDMGGADGLACLARIRAEGIPVRVLVLTGYSDGAMMRAALEGGADGYALKTEPPRQTIECIRQVHRGQLVFPIAARRWLLGRAPTPAGPSLTGRERAVLDLVAEGATNAVVATRLRVSENTVKFHLQNIYLKLGVSNRTEAAAAHLKQSGPRR